MKRQGFGSAPTTAGRMHTVPDPTRNPARWIVPASAFVLVVVLFLAIGRLGYNPTDDGNVLAQSHRILNGEVPHRDVIFARPMGSAVLHVIDFSIPMPLFEASRLIGISEIVAYSFLFAGLIFGIPLSRWGFAHLAGAVGATLVNLHTYPLMGWYTTDGLLFVAAGFVLLRSGLENDRSRLVVWGQIVLGIAPLMKQSFAIAPVLGVIMVAFHGTKGRRPDLSRALRAAAFAAVPLAGYFIAMALLGAADEFLAQVAGAEPVWGRSFITIFGEPEGGTQPVVWLAATAAGLITLHLLGRFEARGVVSRTTFGFPLRIVLSALVVLLPIAEELAYAGQWAVAATWALVAQILIRLVGARKLDRVAVLVAAVAWMVSLSWGYDVPNVVAGTISLMLLVGIWRGMKINDRVFRAGIASLIVLAVAATGTAFLRVRENSPYYDRPKAELTETLADVSVEFGDIRTNRVTAAYLRDVADCIDRYPASRVAVLPDNPGIYPALGLRNPFPLDWMYPNEVEEESRRIVDAAAKLERDGDYLVMFQTFSAFRLFRFPRVEDVPVITEPYFYENELGSRITESLSGTRVTCGWFIGFYRPA